MNQLPLSVRLRVLAALDEGNSIRSIERMTGAHRDTVMRFGVEVGTACGNLHDCMVRGVAPTALELDEIWCFVGKKEGHLREGDPAEYGDTYTYSINFAGSFPQFAGPKAKGAIQNLAQERNATAAAQSRFQDADYAVEVSSMTRARILQQASAAVLAQANQVPRDMLSLISG